MKALTRFLLTLLCTACLAIAADKAPAKLDTMVENAMTKGYNAGDAEAFFAEFAAVMDGIATPENFTALYDNSLVKGKLGKFVSKALVPGETSLNDEAPLLVYKAKFEKGEAKLSVNFLKEGNGLKVMQITIAPQ
jgi:hypothetical protein